MPLRFFTQRRQENFAAFVFNLAALHENYLEQ
jgi:hypothetical protein